MGKLVPGALGDPSEQGKPTEFAGSLADEIEKKLLALLPADRKFDPNDNSKETRDRRTFVVAIAQGVVEYLKANQDAFVVTHTTGQAVAHKLEITT
jgi:hypothetical protein